MVFWAKRNCELIFIPKYQYLPCAVSILRRLFNKYLLSYRIIDINSSNKHISNVSGHQKCSFQKLIVFAHTNKTRTAMLLNGIQTAVEARQFWEQDGISYELFYGHICWGAIFLEDENWKRIFPSWVSHNNKVRLLHGPSKCNKNIKVMMLGVFKTIENASNKEELYENLKIEYNRQFSDIVLKNIDFIDPLTLYTLIFIENSIDTLVMS